MSDHDAIDTPEARRAAEELAAGRTVSATAYRAEAPRGFEVDARAIAAQDVGVVELAQEFATVAKRRVETGVVRVRTVTETEEHVERAELQYETAEVTHHPVNQFVDAMPEARTEGDLTILPVVEERLIVEKRLFVTEEIHIRRRRTTEAVELPVSLRRQHAVVERLDPDGASRDVPPGAAVQPPDRNP